MFLILWIYAIEGKMLPLKKSYVYTLHSTLDKDVVILIFLSAEKGATVGCVGLRSTGHVTCFVQ